MKNIIKRFKRFFSEESGQGLVEYALILVLVSIVVIIVLTALGESINNVFENIGATLDGAI